MSTPPGGTSAPGGNAGGALVICIGNPLRGDDGVAAAVAERLDADPRLLPGTRVVVSHQLSPEMAEEIADATVVVIVDAREDAAPGTVGVMPVADPPDEVPAWTHHVDPGLLLRLAVLLYGRAPRAWAVTVGGDSWDLDDALSPAVAAAIPVAVDRVLACLAETTEPA